MNAVETTGRLEVISDVECVRLLRSNQLGRIALIDWQAHPVIFPVNYFFDEGVILFRTASGTKLDLAPGARVSFEIDGWDPGARIGWSVLAQGIAHEITDSTNLHTARMRAWPVHPQAPGLHDHWIGIWVNEISGRRFQAEAQTAREG